MNLSTTATGRTPVATPLTPARIANLRRDTLTPSLWRPAGKPSRIAASPGVPVFTATVAGADRDITLFLDGRDLYISSAPATQGVSLTAQRTLVGTLPADALAFSQPVNALIRIELRRHTCAYLLIDSDLHASLTYTQPRFPALTIHAVSPQVITAHAAGAKLSGASSGRVSGALSAADNATLSASALRAYRDLQRQTGSLGRFMQLILARYRILGPEGETLFTSPWTIPAGSFGMQCIGAVSFPSADSLASVTDAALRANTYMLQLSDIPALDSPWNIIASRLVVEVTDPMEPVDESEALAAGSVVIDQKTGVTSARVYLPGCSATRAANPGLYFPLALSALAHAEATARVVLSVDRPLLGRDATLCGSADVACAPVFPPMPVYTYTGIGMVPGGRFCFNPEEDTPPPSPLECYGITDSDAVGDTPPLWCSAVAWGSPGLPQQHLADSAAATATLPALLSPLLTVPGEQGGTLSLSCILPDGSELSRSFPLTPLPGAGLSYYLSPDLAPISLPPGEFTARKGRPPVRSADGTLHYIRDGGDPPVASVPSSSRIIAMVQAPRSGGSWDFARRKMLLFTAEGISVATFDATGALRASAPLDSRAIASPAQVAVGDSPSGAAVYAVAGGDLLRILPSRTDTLLRSCRADAIGWCPQFSELWMRSGALLSRCNVRGEVVELLCDDITPGDTTLLRPFGGELLIATPGGLFTTAREESAPLTRCIMRLNAELTAPFRSLEAWLLGSDITATISILGDNGTEIPEPLVSYSLRGEINIPLMLRPRIPRRRFITVEVDGRLSPDSTIRFR